jgi:hypothetical protein
MAQLRIVWHDGKWETRDGDNVVATFDSYNDAWAYRRECMSPTRKLWQRLRRAA